MKSIRKAILLPALIVGVLSAAGLAQARDLTIALATEPSSMDPQFHSLTPNIQFSETIFDPLVRTDANAKPVPCLAESWTVNGNVWLFKLRPNVKFSDGSPFTADDVVFTYARVPKVPNSPSSFTLYLKSIDKVEAVDPLTLKITTKGPSPVLLANLSIVPIMSKKAASGAGPRRQDHGRIEPRRRPDRHRTRTNSCPGGAAPRSCSSATRIIGARSRPGTKSPTARSRIRRRGSQPCSQAASI